MTIHPIFRIYTISELHQLTGYSEVYLLDIRDGRQEARPMFRRVCSRILRKSEDELFSNTEGPSDEGNSGGDDDDVRAAGSARHSRLGRG